MGRREGGGVGAGGGWEAEGGLYHPQGDTQQQCALSEAHAETATVNLVGRDGRWQQFDHRLYTLWFDKPCSLISAPQWLHGPCSVPSWFYRVGKRPSVKADLAIYSPVSGVSVQC